MYKFLLVLVNFALVGCVTDSPEKTLGVGEAPIGIADQEKVEVVSQAEIDAINKARADVANQAPIGAVKKEGNYPVVNQPQVGQIEQFTAEEKAELKSDTGSAVQKAEEQAAQDNQATYLDEVEAMRQKAIDEQKKRLADIESRKYQED